MAMDSELYVLSEAQDVAYQLRADLFKQCSGESGPAQFGNMGGTFKDWVDAGSENRGLRGGGKPLKSELFPFYVDRVPGAPVI